MEILVKSRIEKDSLICEIDYPNASKYTQYAFYLCDVDGNTLVRQGYINQSSYSFPLRKGGAYFVKGYVRSKNTADEELQKKLVRSNVVYYYPVKQLYYDDIEHESFQPQDPMIYQILWDGVKYDFLISYKPDSDQAVVFGSGSINKEMQIPVFRRHSWEKQLKCTGIWYFDPTLYAFDRNTLKGDIFVGWGYGTNDRWYLKDIAHLLRRILNLQNICIENTLFFGSSSGGFMSIMLATMFRGNATVINPQFFVQNFHYQ